MQQADLADVRSLMGDAFSGIERGGEVARASEQVERLDVQAD
ncbi:MAG TPA: hypothetical protein PLS53_14795 [Thermoanaerobaculaceae bacterium]|nr:hypothetical protein [Thermoanaerobaculaceae bacterium]HPS79425.1 hypothetical protein [Thermoanaerobaculaceae bacterium]